MSATSQALSCSANPSNDPRYFRSPVLTLLESLEDFEHEYISMHDIIDAYATLCTRIRDISDVLSHDGAHVPALQCIEQHSVPIVKCLRRDVRRTLADPFSVAPQSSSDLWNFPRFDWDMTPVADEEMKVARDTATLSQFVLRVASYVLRLPALSAAFAADDLVQLADDVLDILQAQSLPIPNSKKIRALSIWVLSQGHFPTASVAPRRTHITRILNEIIEYGDIDLTLSDGLKALARLLQAQSSLFLQPCTKSFPFVLNRLKSDLVHVRIAATHALGSFAFAFLSHEPDARNNLVDPLRRPLQSSINAACAKPAKSSHGASSLAASFMGSLESGDTPASIRGIVRAPVVLASVIALSGSELFMHKATLKFILKTSESLAHHKIRSVRLMNALVWRCLVWAFSELPSSDPAVAKMRPSALELVKQERRHGVGATLISALLRSPPTYGQQVDLTHSTNQSVEEAVAVLRAMAEDRESVRGEARAVLSRLTSAIGSAPTPPSTPASDGRPFGDGVLVKELFDGTILRMSDDRLSETLPDLVRFSVEKIRPLTEAEILGSWDALVDAWTIIIKKDVLGSTELTDYPHDLLGSWQALLLVLAQLTQEHRHLTASPECALRVAGICRDILDFSAKPTDEASIRVNQLRFVFKLWKVAKNVFHAPWLANAAEPILRAALQRTYDLANSDIASAWAELCGALVLASPHDLMQRLALGSEARQEMEIKRHLWSVLAKSWTSSDVKPDWKVIVSLVTLPIGHFTLCDADFAIWEDLLGVAIVSAGSAHITSDQVLETVAAQFDEQSERLSTHPRMAISLLSHLTVQDDQLIPTDFLHLIDDFLCDLYAAEQERQYPALEAFRNLSTLLQSCSQYATVSLVSTISEGLCIWIRDEGEVLPEKEYNDVIMLLYKTTLARLSGYQFPADTLEAIALFLAAAFKRMPSPALGPTAFKEFWASVQRRLTLQSATLPEDFKQALRINHEYFGGHLPSDMSYDSQSQSQSQSQDESIVPETPSSQLLYEPLHLPNPSGGDPIITGSAHSCQGSIFSLARQDAVRSPSGNDLRTQVDGSAPSCSLSAGHAPTEDDIRDDAHTSSQGADFDLSPEIPLPGVSDTHSNGPTNEAMPTAPGNRLVVPRAFSALLTGSPEVPFLHNELSPGPSPSYPLSRRANSLPSSSLQDPTSSLSMQNSPLIRKRVPYEGQIVPVHETGPRKKRRVMPEELEDGVGVSSGGAQKYAGGSTASTTNKGQFAAQRSKSGRVHPSAPERSRRRTKWVFDGIVIPKRQDLRPWQTASDAALSSPSSGGSSGIAEKQVPQMIPSGSLPESDDYDIWEVTVDPAEVRRLQQQVDTPSEDEQEHEHKLTSSQVVDDSLLFVPSSQDDEDNNSPPRDRPERRPALEASSSARTVLEHRVPLNRSHTTSDRLDLLRRARDGIKEDGSQLPPEALSEAEDMLSDMYSVLQRVRRRFGREGTPAEQASEEV